MGETTMNVVTAGDLVLSEEEDAQLVPRKPVDVPKKRSDLLSIIDFGECNVLDSHRPLSREDFDDPGMQQQERTSPPRGRLFAAADGVNTIDAATVHPSDLFSDLVTDDEKRHGDAASRLAAANRKRELSVFDFVPSDEDVRKKPPIPPVPGFVEQLQLIHGLDPFYGVSGDSDSSCGDTGKIEEPATVVRRRRVRNYGKTVRGPKISKVIRVSDDDEWKYDDEDDEWNDPASDSGSEIVSVKDKTVRCTHGKDRSTVKRRIDSKPTAPVKLILSPIKFNEIVNNRHRIAIQHIESRRIAMDLAKGVKKAAATFADDIGNLLCPDAKPTSL